MNVYLDGVIVPWPLDFCVAEGWVDVWACGVREGWMAFPCLPYKHRLFGTVTFKSVDTPIRIE